MFRSALFLVFASGSALLASESECLPLIVGAHRDDVSFLGALLMEPDESSHARAYADYLQEQDDPLARAKGEAIAFALTLETPTGFLNRAWGWLQRRSRRAELKKLQKAVGWRLFERNGGWFVAAPSFRHGIPTEIIVASFGDMEGDIHARTIFTQMFEQNFSELLESFPEASTIWVASGGEPINRVFHFPALYFRALLLGHPGVLADFRRRSQLSVANVERMVMMQGLEDHFISSVNALKQAIHPKAHALLLIALSDFAKADNETKPNDLPKSLPFVRALSRLIEGTATPADRLRLGHVRGFTD